MIANGYSLIVLMMHTNVMNHDNRRKKRTITYVATSLPEGPWISAKWEPLLECSYLY